MAVSTTKSEKKLDSRVEMLLQLIIEARRLKQAAISTENPPGQ